MNVLVVSGFGVIKDIFRSALKQQQFINDVRLINPTEIKSADISKRSRIDGNLDLIIYDLDTICYCPNKKIKAIEDAMILSFRKGSNSRVLFVATEAQLVAVEERISFLEDYLITKPFRLKDVINKLKDISLQSLTS